MGGCSIENGELMSAVNLVLVGKTGNGKSATGNSIIGSKKFESKCSFAGVTSVCEMNTTLLKDGRRVNVIDTPGLFDSSMDHESIGKEIVSCIDLARGGIHAVLLVCSVRSRFSIEEKAVISCLNTLFGSKIFDYMIVVFTGGDELEADGKSLESFLRDSPESLKAKDEAKKANQVQELFSQVTMVSEKNDYEPYTNEIFVELKKMNNVLREQTESLMKETYKHLTVQEVAALMDQMHEKQLKAVIEMLVSKFAEMHVKLEKLLEEERAARAKAEENAKKERKQFEEDKKKLEEEVEKAKKNGWCVIM